MQDKGQFDKQYSTFCQISRRTAGSAPCLPFQGLSGNLKGCLYVFFRPVTMPLQTHSWLLQPRQL